MAELVGEGAQFQCDKGGMQELKVLSSSTTGDSKKLSANGNCMLLPKGGACALMQGAPCAVPTNIVSKEGQSIVTIDNLTALGKGCEFVCPMGGKLSATSTAQSISVHDGASAALQAVSIIVDFVPIVSTIKSIFELITGIDPVTGEETSRLAAAAGIVPGGKIITKGGKVIKAIAKGEKAAVKVEKAAASSAKVAAKSEKTAAKTSSTANKHLEPPPKTPNKVETPPSKNPDNNFQKPEAPQSNFQSQMTPDEAARYEKYWTKHAPEESAPYSTYRRYTPEGDIKQVTTYDQFGNRHRQYDLIDARRPPHQHNFEYNHLNTRPRGIRSDHLPIE